MEQYKVALFGKEGEMYTELVTLFLDLSGYPMLEYDTLEVDFLRTIPYSYSPDIVITTDKDYREIASIYDVFPSMGIPVLSVFSVFRPEVIERIWLEDYPEYAEYIDFLYPGFNVVKLQEVIATLVLR